VSRELTDIAQAHSSLPRANLKKQLIQLRVNGRDHEIAVEPNALLLDVLRQQLQLTGSKRACDDSSCGACTVLVEGVAMTACTLLAVSCEAQQITTIEGVTEHGSLAAIQKAYGDWGGAQCGYCTPGFIMTVKSLLAENPDPSPDDIRAALSSNLCRCTGYTQMYEAIRSAIAAEKVGEVLSDWQRIFKPDGGVLLDVWVLNGNPADWQALLDWAWQKYPTTYLEDGSETTLPSFAMILERLKTVTPLLRIDLGGFTANAHFLSSDEIALEVLPENVDSEAKATVVFELLTGIARLLRKEVILAAEHVGLDAGQLQGRALCVADCNGNLSRGDVKPARVRCGL
jgi:aerobic-type carbon monoxide dehydrogenase small subunit (CoxS/CutS family)